MPKKTPSKNHLLNALINHGYGDLPQWMEPVCLEFKQVLYEDNGLIQNVYFPLDGVVSLVQQMDDGQIVEVATVGNEGFVGVPLFLGADRTHGRALAQIPGDAMRIHRDKLLEQLPRDGALTGVMHRYTQALFVQIAQGNACNRAHSIDQRCARWLLTTYDRVGGVTFPLTQEFLAQMLGVRRAGVSEVASKFQNEGLIGYQRGSITIKNRKGLEARACECYFIIRDEFRRMLRDIED